MELSKIVADIDAEIARLQQAKAILTGAGVPARRGRKPKALTAALAAVSASAPKTRKKRRLSAEGRKRIQEAMKRRWAEHRKNKS
jgi:methylase of polypeptide subunit release factors